ncbi:putative kinesin [Leishmania major strain Friedlin]|uniref:Putative kinesin n=1 Tax=Leishmania major TaxID=5664 RepID=Q4QC92_LEIMA|nr:putative kinesin [Leishmania major strain Friedlin]CAG9573476.1 kinesin_-_putative [Leishmania major strain Friedlin]CAJ04508.1 putative kinesin [Leishmania major strain Friedlin]|eukprot:XP_001683056.1 putative kinesin [Leishmania major strain Friedlin]
MGRGAAQAAYRDDGHIFVCVRIRNVPQNTACLTNNGAAATNTRASTVARKSVLREAQRICVSVVENVVVMHDPASIDDAPTVAKDGNNVVQLLTDRANHAGAARHSRKTAGGGGAAAGASGTSSRRTVGGARATTAGAARLVSTSTASYYECDHCIASMEESQLLEMPLIRTSDFLQPPPYGTQEEVYQRTAMHAVKAAIDGINSCVFAYGQTGSGKTYTLFGDTTNIRRDAGVVPRTLDDLFGRLEAVKQSYRSDKVTDYSYLVHLSFYEIYQNEVYCLFSRQGPLRVQFVRDLTGKKETMIIHDLQQQTVTSAEKAYPMIEMGLRRRQTAETGMNAHSSRSHAILQIRVAQYRTNPDARETVEHQATINLVDLAGSERQKTANTSGTNRAEGIQINQSLATLARVINDIASGARFVNYRDSLLTMVLKDNLGGNSKTFMIANISPIAFSYQESCATLTYAKDVRKVRNRPMVNKTFQTRANLLEQNTMLKQENEKLKVQMEMWVRSLQSGNPHASVTDMVDLLRVRGGGTAEAGDHLLLSPPRSMAQVVEAEQRRAAGVPLAAAGCNEAFLTAISSGLTAPLLISSHRKYTSVAGIGGSCIEGGTVRVSALVKETMEFPLSHVLHPLPTMAAGDTSHTTDEDSHGAQKRHITIPMNADASSLGCASGEATQRSDAAGEAAATAGEVMGLGSLVLERVAQRSCEQRYYVHFKPPTTAEGLSRLIDVQVNGKSIGAKGRRELHHGDVVCAYLEDAAKMEAAAASACLHTQSLISFHYVDLNTLSRGANASMTGMTSATLGQIAVSVDLPADMENLTLEGIKQLQRDNAKLLDMVRQQAETIDYQCAHASTSMMQAEDLLGGISPVGSPGSGSPNPRSLEPSISASPPPETHKMAVALEAFRRVSVSPSIRGGSVMPADLEADELLRRAATQSESKQRLDNAVRENQKLHRTVVSRNATLDALARRLAELEAGGPLNSLNSPSPSSSLASSSSNTSRSADRGDNSETLAGRRADSGEDDTDMSRRTGGNRGSLTCVSSPSQMRAVSAQRRGEEIVETDEDDEPRPEPIGDGQRRIVYENAEGARERYQAVVREREQFDRILELEALIGELRERISELESRLRFSKDETLEQQMFREQAEAERDALLEELANARCENSALRRENVSLEGFLARDEQALADAARLADEELERQTAVLADRIKALKALSRMWKQRTMKYIAMGYGAGSDDKHVGSAGAAHLEAIPWDDLRAAETAAIAKRRLGGGDADACPIDVAQAIDDFEKSTTEDNVRALEYALLNFEQENQRLLDEIRRIKAELDGFKGLVGRLRAEKAEAEKTLADATDSTEEERRRMQQLLRNTNAQLEEAEENLKRTQARLDDAVEMRESNKRKAVRNNELLLSQQKRTIEELETELCRLRRDHAAKEEELTNLTRYMQGRDALGGDGVAKSCELRSRIEELVSDSMEEYDAPNGYSVFPAGFEFSDEMVSLIRICLRILLDRLKMELYVLNAQSVHKYQLLIHAVKARTEAHFHTFMHQLRDAVSQMSGRMLRPGSKWGLSESDVLSTLVDHRRRQVGDALSGLLIWYDHWDNAPKTEHVAYMELIRNADCIMQMARLVRRESLLNTNATSTSLMPIPGKSGTSDTSLLPESSRRNDKTVKGSCKILSRLASSTRQSNLARAVNQFSATPSRATITGREDVVGATPCPVEQGATPFSRSATVAALALSQSMIPFSRTATGTHTSGHQPPSAANLESCSLFSRCPSGFPRVSATTVTATGLSPRPNPSTVTPMRPIKQATSGGAATPAAVLATGASPAALTAAARANYSRMASAGVLPVLEADVAYVANTDVAEAVSISTYNFSRRMSSAAGAGEGAAADKGESVRRPNHLFSRCQTAIPHTSDSVQQQQQRALRRQNSATPASPKAHSSAGATGTRRQVSRAKATEAFARSKTHYTVPKSTATLGRPSRRRSGVRVSTNSSTRSAGSLGGGSLHARPSSSQHNATRRSALYSIPTAEQARGSGKGCASMLSSNATTKPSAAEISLYNLDVMKSLRERSTSDVNRQVTTDSKPSSTSNRVDLTNISSVQPRKGMVQRASSSTGTRVSAGHDTTPVVPRLDFGALEGKH